jgi:effector-binding domain-containing protein
MISEPKTEYRNEQYYVAIKTRVRQEQISEILPPMIPELFDWLRENNLEPAGAPFFKYWEMEGEKMKVEVGVPVDKHVSGDEHIYSGIFPAGYYLEIIYTGPYSNLPKVHVDLAKWREQNHIKIKNSVTEFYPVDPADEPNPEKWQTIIITQLEED